MAYDPTKCPNCGADRKDSFMKGDSWWCGHCGAASISPADRDRYARRALQPSQVEPKGGQP